MITYTQKPRFNRELYLRLRKITRRNRYISELEAENNTFQIGSAVNEIADTYNLTEDVEKRENKQKLHKAIHQLEPEERELIYEIYFNELTLRAYAAKKKLAVSTIHHRKEKTLSKLRELLIGNI